jgi:hypothetical protein
MSSGRETGTPDSADPGDPGFHTLEEQLQAIAISSGKSIADVRDEYDANRNAMREECERERVRAVHVASYEETKESLSAEIEAFRDAVDSLTLETWDREEGRLITFMGQLAQENPYAYAMMMSPIAATYSLWSTKRFMLLVCTETTGGAETAVGRQAITDIETTRFELPQEEFLDEFYLDVINAYERYGCDPVVVRRYRDLLYPYKVPAWDLVIDAPVHAWLAREAVEMLKDFNVQKETGEFEDTVTDEESFEEWCLYLQEIESGRLPDKFISEADYENPRETMHYIYMLDPGREQMFDRTLDMYAFTFLKNKADVRLAKLLQLSADDKEKPGIRAAISHLEGSFCAEVPVPPFGYTLVDDKLAGSIFSGDEEKPGKVT